jgi:hypothetical protein
MQAHQLPLDLRSVPAQGREDFFCQRMQRICGALGGKMAGGMGVVAGSDFVRATGIGQNPFG